MLPHFLLTTEIKSTQNSKDTSTNNPPYKLKFQYCAQKRKALPEHAQYHMERAKFEKEIRLYK